MSEVKGEYGLVNAASLITEAQFQKQVENLARNLKWMVYHPWRSVKSETGFPDLVMVRPPRVIIAELKTEKGKVTKGHRSKNGRRWITGQDEWLAAFEACPGVETYLFRPSDRDDIERILALAT